MKVYMRILIALFLFKALSLPAAEQNILRNGDFEGLFNKNVWSINAWKSGSNVELNQEKAHSGQYSLKIYTGKIKNDVRIAQPVNVKPERFYKFSGWLASENVSQEGVGANIGFAGAIDFSGNLKGNNDWQYAEIYFKTAPKQKFLTIAAGIGMYGNMAEGTVYLDDLELVEVSGQPASFVTFRVPEPAPVNNPPPKKWKFSIDKKILNLMGLGFLALIVIGINLLIMAYRHGGVVRTRLNAFPGWVKLQATLLIARLKKQKETVIEETPEEEASGEEASTEELIPSKGDSEIVDSETLIEKEAEDPEL